MRRVLSIITTAMVICMLAGAAWAVPWTWTDIVDPAPDILINNANPYLYTHDIRGDGFDPGSDFVRDFSLYINLYDDSQIDGAERVRVTLDGWWFAGTYNAANDINLGYGLFGSLFLLEDGLLRVRLTATRGDFMFADSTLTANGNETAPVSEAAPVPEPATLLLLGSGLLALAGFHRKSR